MKTGECAICLTMYNKKPYIDVCMESMLARFSRITRKSHDRERNFNFIFELL